MFAPQGKHVCYASVSPEDYVDVDTFVNHPWIFRDGQTGDKLMTASERRYVYFPREHKLENNTRRVVVIVTPSKFVFTGPPKRGGIDKKKKHQ